MPRSGAMAFYLRQIAWCGLFGMVTWGCGENSGNETPAATGSSGGKVHAVAGASAGGSSGTTHSSGSNAAGGEPDQVGVGGTSASEGECREVPDLPASADALIELPIRLESAGEPLRVGDAAHDAEGAEYRVTQFKVFLSQAAFVTASGSSAPAVFVDADGKALPYGLFLFDAEDAEPKLRLRAPAGAYESLHMNVGMSESCNSGDPTLRNYPLNADSDMYWTWGSSYLFVRFEGQRLGEVPSPFAYHIGNVGEAPGPRELRLKADLNVEAGANVNGANVNGANVNTGPTLVLDVGSVIAPKPASVVENGPHQIQADWMFDNLEHAAFNLSP